MILEIFNRVKAYLQHKRLVAIFLLSYLLIAVIPILIFGSALNQYFFGVLEGKIHDNNRQVLRQFKYNMDFYFNTLNDISMRIYMDTDLSAYRMYSDPLNAMLGIKSLQKYTVGYTYIQRVALYVPEVDKLYSSANALTVDEFFNMNKFEGLTKDKLHALMTGSKDLTVSEPYSMSTIVSDKVNRVAVVVTPILSGITPADRILLYLIDMKNFDNMLSAADQGMLVFTRDNKLLAAGSVYENIKDHIGEITRLIKPEFQGRTIELGNRQYYMQSEYSSYTNLKYVSLIPAKIAMSEMIRIRSIFFAVMVATAIILGIIIAFNMRLNYNPLRLIFQRTLNIIGQDADKPVGYETVNHALDSIESEREYIHTKYNSAKFALKEHLLNQLLGDEISSIQEFNKTGQDLQMNFYHESFCVAVLSLHKAFPSPSRHGVAEIIESCPYGVPCYALPLPEGRIAVFFCMQYPNEAVLSGILEEMREVLGKSGVVADIGVGNIYSGVHRIAKSYMEAMSALEYRYLNDNGVVFFKSAKENMEWFEIEYPEKKVQLLEVLLMEGDTEKISSTVDEIIEFMNVGKLPLHAARCLCYDIINTLLKTMRIISRKYTPMKDRIPDIMALSGFHSSEALSTEVRRVCIGICQHIKQTKEAHIENLAIHIIEYVNKHYCDSRFSIRTMADDLGLSLSNINTYFKKCVDKTPLEYVNEMRLNLAKHLLTATELPVNEITRHIGYIDTPSFLRKFHRQTGVTPGQYRRLHKAGADKSTVPKAVEP